MCFTTEQGTVKASLFVNYAKMWSSIPTNTQQKKSWKIWLRNQIAAAAHQFQASNTAENLHLYVSVLTRLDFREDLEKDRKKPLFGIFTLFTLEAKKLSRGVFHHIYRVGTPQYPLWFTISPPKEEQGDKQISVIIDREFC